MPPTAGTAWRRGRGWPGSGVHGRPLVHPACPRAESPARPGEHAGQSSEPSTPIGTVGGRAHHQRPPAHARLVHQERDIDPLPASTGRLARASDRAPGRWSGDPVSPRWMGPGRPPLDGGEEVPCYSTAAARYPAGCLKSDIRTRFLREGRRWRPSPGPPSRGHAAAPPQRAGRAGRRQAFSSSLHDNQDHNSHEAQTRHIPPNPRWTPTSATKSPIHSWHDRQLWSNGSFKQVTACGSIGALPVHPSSPRRSHALSSLTCCRSPPRSQSRSRRE